MSFCSLAFDTSNYTTSVAVCQSGRIIENRKQPVTVKKGNRGIRQSDAVFAHTVNLAAMLESMHEYAFDCIGVSIKPRDVQGSYMPCFLPGFACAKTAAGVLGIPLYEFSHQRGHIAAALYAVNRLDLYEQKFIAFHLSGGTTEMLLCDRGSITKIGGTLDISAGQLLDRTGVKLGFSFPCGAMIDHAALEQGKAKVSISLKNNECFCNLSGVENQVDDLMRKGCDAGIISRFVLMNIQCAVENMLQAAQKEYGALPVLFSGGVSASQVLCEYFSSHYDALFPDAAFSLDNAAGIAILAVKEHYGNIKS
ncbi:MAG: peptidase M22 [Clostridiales bacterium]|nr:peptidase M22 [Clostridiales bacterium]